MLWMGNEDRPQLTRHIFRQGIAHACGDKGAQKCMWDRRNDWEGLGCCRCHGGTVRCRSLMSRSIYFCRGAQAAMQEQKGQGNVKVQLTR